MLVVFLTGCVFSRVLSFVKESPFFVARFRHFQVSHCIMPSVIIKEITDRLPRIKYMATYGALLNLSAYGYTQCSMNKPQLKT